jgi:hypothetical protein
LDRESHYVWGKRYLMGELWDAQEKVYREDLDALAHASLGMRDMRGARILDSLHFRAACFRLGAVEGPPIRLYDEVGIGLFMPAHLKDVLAMPAGLFAVLRMTSTSVQPVLLRLVFLNGVVARFHQGFPLHFQIGAHATVGHREVMKIMKMVASLAE